MKRTLSTAIAALCLGAASFNVSAQVVEPAVPSVSAGTMLAGESAADPSTRKPAIYPRGASTPKFRPLTTPRFLAPPSRPVKPPRLVIIGASA